MVLPLDAPATEPPGAPSELVELEVRIAPTVAVPPELAPADASDGLAPPDVLVFVAPLPPLSLTPPAGCGLPLVAASTIPLEDISQNQGWGTTLPGAVVAMQTITTIELSPYN